MEMIMTVAAGEKFVTDLKVLAADTQELIRETAGQTGERVVAAREKARQTLADLQRSIQPMQEAVVLRTRLANAYVHDNPWPVLTGVAVLSALVGFALGRR